jgi:hypothetical protein
MAMRLRLPGRRRPTLKTKSIYPGSIFQEQGPSKQDRTSSMSLGKRFAIALVTLAICGIGMWVGVEHALRLTSGGR